jgi:hypothetical protein
MDVAWGEHFGREDLPHPVRCEGGFSGLLRIHRRVRRKRELAESVREREGDSDRAHQAREIATGAMTGVQSLVAAFGSPETGLELHLFRKRVAWNRAGATVNVAIYGTHFCV